MRGWPLAVVGVVLALTGVAMIAVGSIMPAVGVMSRMGPAMMGSGTMGPAMMMGEMGQMAGMMTGMMGGSGSAGSQATTSPSGPGPGDPGFVAGTTSNPRVVPIVATPQLRFQPNTVPVQAGETITFEVTTTGPMVHEFVVGPAADVAADAPGTPVIEDIGPGQTGSLTYTFSGTGPYAFACHVPGHYESGMTGSIVLR